MANNTLKESLIQGKCLLVCTCTFIKSQEFFLFFFIKILNLVSASTTS